MAKLTASKRLESNEKSGSRLRDSLVFRQSSDRDLSLSERTDSTLDASSSSLLHGSMSSVTESAMFDANESSSRSTLPRQELLPRALSEGHLPSAMSSPSLGPRVKKTVSWSNVEIKHHAIVLGDNPSVSSGPPVALGPEVLHMDSISVLDYEAARPPRREKFQMALPRMIREDMLKDHGYARADFRDAEVEIRKIKKNRQASASATLWEKLRHTTKSRRFIDNLKEREVDNPLIA